MTVPRVADLLRKIIPKWRVMLSPEEAALAPSLRGNEPLYKALTGIINSRIAGRAHAQVPSDPLICKSMLDRDNELRWLLSRLDFIYRSPVTQPGQEDEESSA